MTKVLIVCSGTSGQISPFVRDQVVSLKKLGIEADFFAIKRRGALGYFHSYMQFLGILRERKYDLIHAHYGLSGLLSAMQWKVPCVITFHGSDINVIWVRPLSFLASRLSAYNIFVHPSQHSKLLASSRYAIIPCGVDLKTFFPLDRNSCRRKMKLEINRVYGLFSSGFSKEVKNYSLAKNAIDLLGIDINLIELKGYSREEVNLLMNAVDFLIVTSFSETGPVVVKEAMACNLPVVSTDVGDVRWVTRDLAGCYLTSFDPGDVAAKLKIAADFAKKDGRTRGRDRIIELGLDSEIVARRIWDVYESVLARNEM